MQMKKAVFNSISLTFVFIENINDLVLIYFRAVTVFAVGGI